MKQEKGGVSLEESREAASQRRWGHTMLADFRSGDPLDCFPSHFCATNKRKQTVLVPSLSKLPGDHRVNIYDLALPFWMTLGNEGDFPRNDAVSNLRQVRKV